MLEALVAALLVDGLEAPRGDQPGHRILRQPFGRPLLHGRAEGFVQRFLGALEVAEQADQRREDAARILAVDLVDLGADARDFWGGHARRINGDSPHFLAKGAGPQMSRAASLSPSPTSASSPHSRAIR